MIRIGEKLAKAQFDTVQTSVFAPTVAPLDQQFLVQVWLHTPEMVEAAAAGAGEADPGSARKTVRSLLAEIARGAKVEVELISPELDIDAAERTKTLIWRGRPEAYDFIVRVSAKSGIRDIFPTVVVTADGIPVGSVRFKLSCAPKIAPRYPTTRAMPAPGLAAGLAALGGSTDLVAADADGCPYRKAFISYSNKDIDEAVLIATGLQAGNPGLEYFIDVATMRAGDNWRQRIQDYIGGCDLFVLVWSNNAKASSEVENEWRYALVQAATRDGGGPVVHPVPIEGPPIPTPPPELAHINFRDRLQYIRVAAAAEPSVQTRR